MIWGDLGSWACVGWLGFGTTWFGSRKNTIIFCIFVSKKRIGDDDLCVGLRVRLKFKFPPRLLAVVYSRST